MSYESDFLRMQAAVGELESAAVMPQFPSLQFLLERVLAHRNTGEPLVSSWHRTYARRRMFWAALLKASDCLDLPPAAPDEDEGAGTRARAARLAPEIQRFNSVLLPVYMSHGVPTVASDLNRALWEAWQHYRGESGLDVSRCPRTLPESPKQLGRLLDKASKLARTSPTGELSWTLRPR